MKPLWDRVVIRPVEVSGLSPGGIHIPDDARRRPCSGEVVAVGPGVYNDKGHLIEAGVKVGDVVMYLRYPISAVEYDGLLIMRPIDVLGVIENGEE